MMTDKIVSSLKGSALDAAIDSALLEMLAEGFATSPISRKAVQKRLNLKSRSTLIGKRAMRIKVAQDEQLRRAGLRSKQSVRATQRETILHLQDQVKELESVRDRYFQNLIEIVQLLQSKGLAVESHLTALRAKDRIDVPRS